ncbi:hypothetical protein E1171_14990 [Cytophagales bacterium RKSG123]|nr:hypothetical protein [Xanthovirga aplysinae]
MINDFKNNSSWHQIIHYFYLSNNCY